MLQSFVLCLWEMRIHLLFTLYRFNPQIRQINASAQGPVWEQHHSFWAQREWDRLSAFTLFHIIVIPLSPSLAEPPAHSFTPDDELQS